MDVELEVFSQRAQRVCKPSLVVISQVSKSIFGNWSNSLPGCSFEGDYDGKGQEEAPGTVPFLKVVN